MVLTGTAERSIALADGKVTNKFHEDKTGKDFLVEFPLDANAKNIHEAPITACVQVKSTDKKRRKEQITVSNLKRLATELGPSFIVFIEHNGRSSVVTLKKQACAF